jgi:hypothetical protein
MSNKSAKHPQMTSYHARLASFDKKSWPHNKDTFIASPQALAETGFFYDPRPPSFLDRCVCFYCGVSLVGWEQTDFPRHEHLVHSPNCGFLEQPKKRQIPKFQQIYRQHFNELRQKHRETERDSQEKVGLIREIVFASLFEESSSQEP